MKSEESVRKKCKIFLQKKARKGYISCTFKLLLSLSNKAKQNRENIFIIYQVFPPKIFDMFATNNGARKQ